MRITETQITEIQKINEIIEASKRFWDYAETYLNAAIPLIQINESWLAKSRSYSIYEDEIQGFMGIESSDDSWLLEHLWIKPARIKVGLGRKAVEYALALASCERVKEIYLLPDPPAEGFYKKLGAAYTGKTVPSRVECGPLFREMIFKV